MSEGRGISLNIYERESLLKSFGVFFALVEVLLLLNYWYEYRNEVQALKRYIHTDMRLCAYALQCNGMQTDFVEESGKEADKNILYEKENFYAYFDVPSKNFLMKVEYPRTRFETLLRKRVETLRLRLLFYSLLAALFSLFFAWYTLLPLRKALRLNEEFVRDILHDFNTPLASMRINLKLLKKETGENTKIERLEHNIETIMALQSNLKIFLKALPTQKERFDVTELLRERIVYFQTLYADIAYEVQGKALWIEMNRDAFVRIVDNLLSNAGKYNRPKGRVIVRIDQETMLIEDTGMGIAFPEKVFERFYKEQERGIGIGLHVVKKLCDETGIGITIESEKGEGTRVKLDLAAVTA